MDISVISPWLTPMFMTQQRLGAWISERELRVVNGRLNELPDNMPAGIKHRVYMLSNQRHCCTACRSSAIARLLFSYFVKVASFHHIFVAYLDKMQSSLWMLLNMGHIDNYCLSKPLSLHSKVINQIQVTHVEPKSSRHRFLVHLILFDCPPVSVIWQICII